MTNLYWPTYLSIEKEFNNLLSIIHVDDNQLNVYSGKISELILRSASEVESISKELYQKNGGTKKGNIHFDFDAIDYLDKNWILSQKVLIISTINSFQSEKTIIPFQKDYIKNKETKTYSWNHSYQSIKHDRVRNIKLGSIKNLFGITAALFILNIYFKDQTIDLEKDNRGNNFPLNQGSSIFSIKFHDGGSGEIFNKAKDIEECIYTSKATGSTLKVLKEACNKQRENQQKLILNHPIFLEYISKQTPDKLKNLPSIYEILGKEEHSKVFRESFRDVKFEYATEQLRHEANLNKNQF